ncbi:ion transporter, partial [Klebsiella pneumoniae]|nr:ion transporter [Klebsiella pneumoniae]
MVLRILRVLRVLRAISIIPSLRKMVNALLLTIPSMGTIMILLGLFFYVYAVIGTTLFASISPEYFGSL